MSEKKKGKCGLVIVVLVIALVVSNMVAYTGVYVVTKKANPILLKPGVYWYERDNRNLPFMSTMKGLKEDNLIQAVAVTAATLEGEIFKIALKK